MTVSVSQFIERAASIRPEAPGVTSDGITRNFREIWRRCQNLAGAFVQLGLKPGDRVAYLGFNSCEFYECYFAPALAQLELVSLNWRWTLPELVVAVEDSQPRLIIADTNFIDMAEDVVNRCQSVDHLVISGCGASTLPSGAVSYESMIALDVFPQCEPSAGDDTLIIYYTGGTTGKAKGVMLSHWNVFSNAIGTLGAYEFPVEETHLLMGPMFHTAAGSRVFATAIMHSHLVMLPRFDTTEMFRLIEHYRIGATQVVPTMLQIVLDSPDFGKYDLTSLKHVTYGAAPTPEGLLERALDALPHVDFVHGYGMTEGAPLVATLRSEYHKPGRRENGKLGSIGQAVAHCDVRVFDPYEQEVPRGEIGEIVVRGPNIMKGYLNRPEATAEALRGGWYHTGDLGYCDVDGFLYVSGRLKEMIISGGENIYPLEIENVLSHHKAIAESAVFGLPDEKWGESVHAVVITRTGYNLTESDVIDYCRLRLADYKCPRSVTFRTDPMPLSGANKVLKSLLQESLLRSP